MPDKSGDRFTDKHGKNFVLGTDPKGGHLRPYAEGKQPSGGCASIILLFVSVAVVIVYAVARIIMTI